MIKHVQLELGYEPDSMKSEAHGKLSQRDNCQDTNAQLTFD
jgi:hypothetical protein